MACVTASNLFSGLLLLPPFTSIRCSWSFYQKFSYGVECHTRAVQRADALLEGIEHLGSLMTCKANIYQHDFFMAALTGGGDERRPPNMWQALEDEVSKVINKHLRGPEPEVSCLMFITCTIKMIKQGKYHLHKEHFVYICNVERSGWKFDGH